MDLREKSWNATKTLEGIFLQKIGFPLLRSYSRFLYPLCVLSIRFVCIFAELAGYEPVRVLKKQAIKRKYEMVFHAIR
jgi:hypothetical protein